MNIKVTLNTKFLLPIFLPFISGVLLYHDTAKGGLVTAVSDHPQAIFFRRRPISLSTRSNKDVVFGAILVLFHPCAIGHNAR